MNELLVPFAVGWVEMVMATALTRAILKDRPIEAAAWTATSTYLWFYVIGQFAASENQLGIASANAAGGALGVITVMRAKKTIDKFRRK